MLAHGLHDRAIGRSRALGRRDRNAAGVKAGRERMEVAVLRITEAGRRALREARA
jgi:hypothetical protein